MGRGNAQEKAALARAKLAAAAQAQAEIAAQAIEAVESGLDPKIAADLATRAATEISQEISQNQNPVDESTSAKFQNTANVSPESRKVRIKNGYSGPEFTITGTKNNIPFLLHFDHNGKAEHLSDIIEYLVTTFVDDYEYDEE